MQCNWWELLLHKCAAVWTLVLSFSMVLSFQCRLQHLSLEFGVPRPDDGRHHNLVNFLVPDERLLALTSLKITCSSVREIGKPSKPSSKRVDIAISKENRGIPSFNSFKFYYGALLISHLHSINRYHTFGVYKLLELGNGKCFFSEYSEAAREQVSRLHSRQMHSHHVLPWCNHMMYSSLPISFTTLVHVSAWLPICIKNRFTASSQSILHTKQTLLWLCFARWMPLAAAKLLITVSNQPPNLSSSESAVCNNITVQDCWHTITRQKHLGNMFSGRPLYIAFHHWSSLCFAIVVVGGGSCNN